jgi:hypothetical protein
MSKRTLFYATERDVFEALTAFARKFPNDVLFELARKRGILLSEDEDRESLIEYMSLLPHDYNDFEALIEALNVNARQEKVTSITIPKNINRETLSQTIREVFQKRSPYGEVFNMTSLGNKLEVKVEYTEMDLSKTRLRQRIEKDATIELETSGSETHIRRPSNEKTNEIVNELIAALEAKTNSPLDRQTISLAGVADSAKLSKFFTDLITNVEGTEVKDVTLINVDSLEGRLRPDIETEDTNDVAMSDIDKKMLSYVRKVVIDGKGLLYSEEYDHLSKQGFYISRISWIAEEIEGERRRIEFEALFENAKNSTGFSYSVKGFHKKLEDDKHSISRYPLSATDKTHYFEEIEKSAKKSFEAIADLDVETEPDA